MQRTKGFLYIICTVGAHSINLARHAEMSMYTVWVNKRIWRDFLDI